MKTLIGISRWSNPNRAAAVHVDDGHGKPLCGGMGRKSLSWEPVSDEPTCARCIRAAQHGINPTGAPSATPDNKES